MFRKCCAAWIALKAFLQCSNACVQVVLIWPIPGKSLNLFCAPVVPSCCEEAAPGALLCVRDGVGVCCSVSSSHPVEVPEQPRDCILHCADHAQLCRGVGDLCAAITASWAGVGSAVLCPIRPSVSEGDEHPNHTQPVHVRCTVLSPFQHSYVPDAAVPHLSHPLTNTGVCSPSGGSSPVPRAGGLQGQAQNLHPSVVTPVPHPHSHPYHLPSASRARLQARPTRVLTAWHPALPSCPPSVPLTAVQVTRWLPLRSHTSFCLQAGSGAPITCCLRERGSSN